MNNIPFYEHDLGAPELSEIARVFEGKILTTGKTVEEFEEKFADYLKVKYAIGVTSCTAALQLSLHAYGIGDGDEVITSSLTFIATATAIIQAGAIPVLVDSEETSGNIDLDKIEQAITPRTKAIIPVHMYGQMVDMKKLKILANKYQLKIIEDSAHCIEGSRASIRPGQMGDTACFSFYATKNITCGEGGAIITNNVAIAKKLKLLRLHGMEKSAYDREKSGYSHWDMPIFGWKYNMDNIQAAILLPQLTRIEENYKRRKLLAERYTERIMKIPSVTLFENHPESRHALHLMPIRVPNGVRDELIEYLKKSGISTVVNYRPVHVFSFFRQKYGYHSGSFPVSESIGSSVISLPLYPSLTEQQIDIVADRIEHFMTIAKTRLL